MRSTVKSDNQRRAGSLVPGEETKDIEANVLSDGHGRGKS